MAALMQHNYMFQDFPGTKTQKDEKSVELSSPTESIQNGNRFIGYTDFDNHDHKKTTEFLKQPGAKRLTLFVKKLTGLTFQ